MEDLVQQIQQDQRKREHDKIEFPFIFNTYNQQAIDAQSITGPNKQFIQSQLIIDHLLEIQSDDANKTQFISLCKNEYKNNQAELRIIQEFQHTYSSTRSLSWYTRNCFLNRILNKALQMQNISILLNCLFFIRDIQQQIELNKSSSIHRVYHAQFISKEELGILYKSLGQLISINTFLSATSDRQQAFSVLQDSETSNNILKVLFEIDTNPQVHGTQSFADITSLGCSSKTNEILFMMGSIFRLENLSYDKSGIIIISMSKYNQPIFEHLKTEYAPNSKKTILSLGLMLNKFNRFDDAEQCYHHLIEHLPDKHQTISKCYHALGNLASNRNDYNASLEWHEKSIEIKKKTLSETDPSVACSYNSIGAVYHKIGDYERALDLYKQALGIWGNVYDENHLYVAMCYNNMGLVYEESEKYSEALDCYEKVLKIRQKLLSNDHIDLGNVYMNLGMTHQSLNHFDLALKYFNQALIIFKRTHRLNTAFVLKQIGMIYERQSQFEDALSNYQQTLTIYRQLLPEKHSDIIEIEKNIGNVRVKIEE